MNKNTIGISDIKLYIPEPNMNLDRLIKERVAENPKLERHLARAVNTTGQESIRFPNFWEDTSTMAAEAAYQLLGDKEDSELSKLRFITVGTETGVDHSKPVSAYVEGMLKKGGLNIPESLSSFQVQHACAGGTLALLSVSALLNQAPERQESGVVMCSDIAKYESASTAEVTQGAGAAALFVENNPKLLEIDLSTLGYCSKDVDDFFRPNGSKFAKVKGRYSMELYAENLESAFLDHCKRRNLHPAKVLSETDMFVLHAPFRNMPEIAMKRLLQKNLGLVNGQTEAFLESKGFYGGLDAVAKIGNTYSASMYVALTFLLKEQYEKYGDNIAGKNIILASYGSGNTMIVISVKVAPEAPSIIKNWDLEAIFESGKNAEMIDYKLWMNGPYDGNTYNDIRMDYSIPAGLFYLKDLREDGYREYDFTREEIDNVTQGKTSRYLHRSIEILG